MSEQPKTATSLLMQSYAERQHEMRARNVAMASASRAFEEFGKPDEIEDLGDARRMMMRVAEMAAYYAIEAERENMAGDMQMVRKVVDAQFHLKTLEQPASLVGTSTD